MTTLDEALEGTQPAAETAVSLVRSDRKCARHRWYSDPYLADGLVIARDVCACGTVKDPVRSRRGRSSRRLGHDQERRAERRYGWEKIGERGEKTDLRGRFAKVQQKASRRPPPAMFRDTFAGLDATKDGRVALLLLTYVCPKGTTDYVVIRGEDWLELHGVDVPETVE